MTSGYIRVPQVKTLVIVDLYIKLSQLIQINRQIQYHRQQILRYTNQMTFMRPSPGILWLNKWLKNLVKQIFDKVEFLSFSMGLASLQQIFTFLISNFNASYLQIATICNYSILRQTSIFLKNGCQIFYPFITWVRFQKIDTDKNYIYFYQIFSNFPKIAIITITSMIEQKNQQNSTLHVSEQSSDQNIMRRPVSSSSLSNNFFQVTINSERLSDLFQNINQIMTEQNKKIEKITKDMHSMFSSIENKLQAESKKSGLLFTKLDLKISDSANTQHCYLMDVHKKSELRDFQIGQKIQALSSKVGRVQDTAKDDLMNGLIYLKKQIIGDYTANQQQNTENNQPSSKQGANSAVAYQKIDFKYLRTNFEKQLQKLRSSLKGVFSQLYDAKQVQKKKKHTQDMIDVTFKKQTENKQRLKNEQQFLRVVYPSSKKGGLKQKQNQLEGAQLPSKFAPKMTRHMSFTKFSGSQEQIVNNYREMTERIFLLEQNFSQQNQIINELKNRETVIDEKSMILTRKFQKLAFEIVQLRNNIRRVQSQKIDDKIIEELRNYIKWGVRDLEDKVNKKCSDQDLSRQKNRLNQKISILHQNLIEKADKSQIQKALLFLQGKIKQIIFLIAAEHSQQRQGAIMKIAAKCLSCDKQVERQVQSQSKCKRQMNRTSQGQYMKSMTHRVRQKYKKQIAQTAGNQTFDD